MSPQNRQTPPSRLDITCAGIVLLLAAAGIIGVHVCEARGADGTPAHIILQIIVSTYTLCNIIYFIAFLIIRETNANPIPKSWTIRAACAPILLVLTAPALLILGIEKAWESTKKLRKHLSDTDTKIRILIYTIQTCIFIYMCILIYNLCN